MDGITVGLVLRDLHLAEYAGRLPQLMQRIERAGLDRVVVGDHISFQGGNGVDGLIQAGALLAAHPTLPVQTGIYLLVVRHPVLVARQLATIALLAPDRFEFGVGVGGEDPHEFEICGVDPRTRGARTDEALPLVRQLLTGETVSHQGNFFNVVEATIRGADASDIPILIGGRSTAAVMRTARHGDGWIGLWVSPRRYAEATSMVAAEAEKLGRSAVVWLHQYQTWCFFAPDRTLARDRAAAVLGSAYDLPFERFERYTLAGTADGVAQGLLPYVAAGCTRFNLVADAPSLDRAIEEAGHVKHLLQQAAA